MKKRYTTKVVVLILFVILSIVITACISDTLAASDEEVEKSTISLPIVSQGGVEAKAPKTIVSLPYAFQCEKNNYSGDDDYDPAAFKSLLYPSHCGGKSYSGDDDYDPAANQ